MSRKKKAPADQSFRTPVLLHRDILNGLDRVAAANGSNRPDIMRQSLAVVSRLNAAKYFEALTILQKLAE